MSNHSKFSGSPKVEWLCSGKPAPSARLPAGGIYPPYGHIGHWEVTGKVAEEMGFSSPARNILCDAAQDPDFYDFATVAAHAQTPDAADNCGTNVGEREAIINKAIDDYVDWISVLFNKCQSALENGEIRKSLYWLGYTLHSIEDLAVHKGITNGEHASTESNPDYEAADVALSYIYARRMLDAVRNALGQAGFDRLRNHNGEGKLSFLEKRSKDIHPNGWDIVNHASEYKEAGNNYLTINPAPAPVRWDREYVLSRILENTLTHRITRMKKVGAAHSVGSANANRRFEVLKPLKPMATAEWTVLVYMAGDDSNPDGIEYAIAQDLAEIKQIGSSDSVQFIVQTDDASGKASYRYRLRKGTDLGSDRIERFNGDLNTGSTKTLVDFVKWAHQLFPAKQTALVLWGHGSGHDDQNVYRAIRGTVSPRLAARLAQKKLGFFSGTKKSILEQGPTRGYGYDDTAGDFLDNAELRKALLQIKEILGRKLDILGFDACLMAMVEVAYQIQDTANILVASERTEPGDGWWYSRAFRGLGTQPKTITSQKLAQDIVRAYRAAYENEMTLSAIDLEKLPQLAEKISAWAKNAKKEDKKEGYHHARRSALDCSPRAGDGYCDLGSFLAAASVSELSSAKAAVEANRVLKEAIIASCGKASGLTIYAPGNFRPKVAGSTDALYMGLKFARETGWGAFLEWVYPRTKKSASGIDTLMIPTPVSGLDRYNTRHILAAARSKAKTSWIDRLRSEILEPYTDIFVDLTNKLDALDPPKHMIETIESLATLEKTGKTLQAERRIIILPGIMGSLLHDRAGKLGAVWIDPLNLVFGDDFEAMKLKWDMDSGMKAVVNPLTAANRIPDADNAVQIEAYGVVPIIYDRLALALMHNFGPIVEYAPYDWRQPINVLGDGLVARINAITQENPNIQIALVAHSMGGLVATDALSKLGGVKALDAIKSFVVMGTPFLGSGSSLQALRAERSDLHLFKLLSRKSVREIENTVQSFRGLFDMMPADQEKLRHPSVFAPGPLSGLMPGDARLNSPQTLVRDLSPALQKKTRAIICTTRNTTGEIVIGDDGTADYSDIVAGDGSVSAQSALNDGKLLSQSIEVDQGHMALPLDGKAIEQTINWVGQQFDLATSKTAGRALPDAPAIQLPKSRDDLARRLEAENELTLGDFVALMSII